MTATVDPITRYFHVSYAVPTGAPDEVGVRCKWSPPGANDWHPAKVIPRLSETGRLLATRPDWKQWVTEGRFTERRAAGLTRTVVFMPYPQAERDGQVDVDFRVELQAPDGPVIDAEQIRLQADNSDVVYADDWRKVLQPELVSTSATQPAGLQWWFRTGLAEESGSGGTVLHGPSPPDRALEPLTFPLDLHGPYAVFFCGGGAGLRLSGDERYERIGSGRVAEEILWRWGPMDRQHLVLRQIHSWNGWSTASVDYVKLVPLTPELVRRLDAPFEGPRDKVVGGYYEPYSWAFEELVTETMQHREPLVAFREARVSIVDIQLGRFGDKVNYESRRTDPCYFDTLGDPVAGEREPHTRNVGRMQLYTNCLDAELRYARDLGLRVHANFGATNCYPGTPLQGDFSKAHPEWMRGSALRFEVPEVQDYALSLYEESLEIGARGLSLDFCRYPEALDTAATGNTFLRRLRALANRYSRRNDRVEILVRFPAKGVRLWQNFDYATWAKQGWVGYLCPSNIQGRHFGYDIGPYLKAVKGTRTKLLPAVDGLMWGLPWPGPTLQRVREMYRAGADGVYIYQADGRVLARPEDRRAVAVLGSSAAVERWFTDLEAERPACSKGVYLSPPIDPSAKYNPYERLRVWTEGLPQGEMDLLLDGKLVTHCAGPPYLLGTEEYESDHVIPPGDHELLVRVRDGTGWFEQRFNIGGDG
ncbi:MAG: hypothetical protein HYU66_02770 [Armatimonadetes bacterium]|nr:hypothetical protein [Armatimonadota bacterium]